MNAQRNHDGIKRRTLAKGVAWAVPVVAATAAAPAYAASGPGPRLVYQSACKSPGASCDKYPNKAYRFSYEVSNPSSVPIYIYSATVTASTATLTFHSLSPTPPGPGQGVLVPPNDTIDLVFQAVNSDSGNHAMSVTICADWGHTLVNDEDEDAHPPVCGDPIAIPKWSPHEGNCDC